MIWDVWSQAPLTWHCVYVVMTQFKLTYRHLSVFRQCVWFVTQGPGSLALGSPGIESDRHELIIRLQDSWGDLVAPDWLLYTKSSNFASALPFIGGVLTLSYVAANEGLSNRNAAGMDEISRAKSPFQNRTLRTPHRHACPDGRGLASTSPHPYRRIGGWEAELARNVKWVTPSPGKPV